MNWYRDSIFLYLMNKNIGKADIMERRQKLLKNVKGNTLEVGIGAGVNLPLYPRDISSITAVDPYKRELTNSSIFVPLFSESADNMHFSENTFDSVVSTFSLCSVGNLMGVASEIYRVLKPGGRFIFLEHGKAKNKTYQAFQKIFNPLFNVFACGCNITRNHFEELKITGFKIIKFEICKAPIFPRLLAGYLYEGIAEKPGGF